MVEMGRSSRLEAIILKIDATGFGDRLYARLYARAYIDYMQEQKVSRKIPKSLA